MRSKITKTVASIILLAALISGVFGCAESEAEHTGAPIYSKCTACNGTGTSGYSSRCPYCCGTGVIIFYY